MESREGFNSQLASPRSGWRDSLGKTGFEPEFYPIEEIRAHDINERSSFDLVSGPEADGCCEHSLEALDDATVVRSVLWQVKEIKNLGGAGKVDLAALLLGGERRDPNGYKAVLAKWQAEVGMGGDTEKKFAIVPRIAESLSRWSSQRDAAEKEGAVGVGEIGMAVFAPLADEADGLDAF